MSQLDQEPQPNKEYHSCRRLGVAVLEQAFQDCYSVDGWASGSARYFLLSNDLDAAFMRDWWFSIAQTPQPQDAAAMLMAIRRFGVQNPTIVDHKGKRSNRETRLGNLSETLEVCSSHSTISVSIAEEIQTHYHPGTHNL